MAAIIFQRPRLRLTFSRFIVTLALTVLVVRADPPVGDGEYLPMWWQSQELLYYPSPELLPDAYANFPPGEYQHCHWGNLQDSSSGIFGDTTLAFTRLTEGPFNQDTEDLFLTGAESLDEPAILSRLAMPDDQVAEWTEPDYSEDRAGSVKFPISGGAALYRKLHFPTSLSVGLSKELPPSTEKLILVIHGWNPNSDSDSYGGSEFSALNQALEKATEATDWAVAQYHWEKDSDTGEIGITGAVRATRAAEIARMHGSRLGSLLQSELPHLKKVQIICHSAGTWVGRECCRYLTLNQSANPLSIELTLLDPFVPGRVLGISSFLNKVGMDRMVRSDIDGYDFGNDAEIFRLENFFSADLDGAVGTSGGFSWRERDTGNFMTHSATLNGSIFSWGNDYRDHSGPIQFYADSIDSREPSSPHRAEALDRLDHPVLRSSGWNQSLFWSEPVLRGSTYDSPLFLLIGQAFPASMGTLTTRGCEKDSEYFVDDENLPALRYRWFKRTDGPPEPILGQDWISVSSADFSLPSFKSHASEGDDGIYGILVESTFHGSVQSDYFDLLNLSTQRTPIVANGLVGWWEFDGNVLDISGSGNHGQLYHGAPVSYIPDRFGRSNRAMLLEDGGFVMVPDHEAIRISTSATTSFWMKSKPIELKAACDEFIPLVKNSSQNRISYVGVKTLFGNRLRVEMPFGDSEIRGYAENTGSTTTLNPEKWNFLVITILGQDLNLFVNGQRERVQIDATDGGEPSGGTNGSLFFGFGGSRDANNIYLPRALDSIRIWNRPLSPEEIWLLYKNDAPVDAVNSYPSHPDYALWIASHATSNISTGPLEDANGDGVCNLIEFGLTPMAGGSQDQQRPKVEQVGGGTSSLEFSRRSGDEHLSFVVQSSPDLLNWSDVAKATGIGALVPLPGQDEITVTESNIPGGKSSSVLVPSSGMLFLKVQVSDYSSP